MMTLVEPLRVGAFTAYRDVGYPAGKRTLTNRFYVVPDAPRVAPDGRGGPALRLLLYRKLVTGSGGVASMGGGMLTLTITTEVADAERSALVASIAARAGLRVEDVELAPLPIRGGHASLAFAANADDLVGRPAGDAPLSMGTGGRVTFAIGLTEDGAALLDAGVVARLALLLARFEVDLEIALDGLALRVFCDGEQALNRAKAQALSGGTDVPALVKSLVAARLAGVEIVASSPVAPEATAALTALGASALEAAVRAALFTGPPDAETPRSALDATTSAALSFTLDDAYAAPWSVTVQGLLDASMGAADLGDRVTRVDLTDASLPFDVTFLCLVDFSRGLVSAVHVYVDDGVKPQDFAFRPGDELKATVRLWGDGGARRYRHRASVFYVDHEPAELDWTTTDETIVVLDFARLGVLDLTTRLFDVPFELVRSVVLHLEHPAARLAREVVLDAGRDADRWLAVLDPSIAGRPRARASWLLADDTRVEGDWVEARGDVVYLMCPRSIAARRAVQVIAAGDFEGVAQIVVEARVDASSAPSTMTFSKPGEVASFELHEGATRYEHRQTVVYQDGTTRQTDWAGDDSAILVARDLFAFTVLVVSKLLALDEKTPLALFELRYDDETSAVHQKASLVLRPGVAEAPLRFSLGAPDRRRYRFQVTLVDDHGSRREGPWLDDDKEVLVLQPPDPTA